MNAIMALMEKLKTRRTKFAKDQSAFSAMGDIAVAGILVVLAFIIIFSFLPLLNSSAATAAADPNASSSEITLINLVPFVIVAGLLIGAVVFLVDAVQKIRG